jgi:hypothetical protein
MSWLREEPQNNPDLVQWAGAQSVASLVSIGPGDTVRLDPHPDLTRLLLEPLTGEADEEAAVYQTGSSPVEVAATNAQGLRMVIEEGDRTRATVVMEGDSLVVTRPGFTPESQPADPSDGVVVLVDADILEIFTSFSYGAYRIGPAEHPPRTRIRATGPAPIQVRPLAI